MTSYTRTLGVCALILTIAIAAAGCGSKQATVSGGSDSGVPEGYDAMRDQAAPSGLLNSTPPDQQNAMIEGTRIAAEAIRKGELPPPEQMEKLSPEQQEAIRRAVQAAAGG